MKSLPLVVGAAGEFAGALLWPAIIPHSFLTALLMHLFRLEKSEVIL